MKTTRKFPQRAAYSARELFPLVIQADHNYRHFIGHIVNLYTTRLIVEATSGVSMVIGLSVCKEMNPTRNVTR